MLDGFGVNDADYIVDRRESYYENGKRRSRRVWACPYYEFWRNMIFRCYNTKRLEKFPTYKDVEVCEEWRYFSNFRRWAVSEGDIKGKVLDKDLKGCFLGYRVYSPDTCKFLHPRVNSFLSDAKTFLKGKENSSLVGCSWVKRDSTWRSYVSDPVLRKNIYLGDFDCEVEAHRSWLLGKISMIPKLRENGWCCEEVESLLFKRYVDRLCEVESADFINLQKNS